MHSAKIKVDNIEGTIHFNVEQRVSDNCGIAALTNFSIYISNIGRAEVTQEILKQLIDSEEFDHIMTRAATIGGAQPKLFVLSARVNRVPALLFNTIQVMSVLEQSKRGAVFSTPSALNGTHAGLDDSIIKAMFWIPECYKNEIIVPNPVCRGLENLPPIPPRRLSFEYFKTFVASTKHLFNLDKAEEQYGRFESKPESPSAGAVIGGTADGADVPVLPGWPNQRAQPVLEAPARHAGGLPMPQGQMRNGGENKLDDIARWETFQQRYNAGVEQWRGEAIRKNADNGAAKVAGPATKRKAAPRKQISVA